MSSSRAWTSHVLRVAGASIAVQLAACILPAVTQQPDPPATASMSESTTMQPAPDDSMSIAQDSVSTEPPATPDAGVQMAAPSAVDAGGSAGSAGMSSMSTAGQSAAGSPADAPGAGKSGSASPALPLTRGDACRSADQCASGHCADGVCCDTACERECEQCNTKDKEGRCVLLDGEPDFDSCPNSQNVCARGVCLQGNGASCASDYECASGICGTNGSGDCCSMRCTACHRCVPGGEGCEPTSGQACGTGGVCVDGRCMPQ